LRFFSWLVPLSSTGEVSSAHKARAWRTLGIPHATTRERASCCARSRAILRNFSTRRLARRASVPTEERASRCDPDLRRAPLARIEGEEALAAVEEGVDARLHLARQRAAAHRPALGGQVRGFRRTDGARGARGRYRLVGSAAGHLGELTIQEACRAKPT